MEETRFSVSLDHLTNESVIQMQALSVTLADSRGGGAGRGSLTLYLSPQKDVYQIIVLLHLQERMTKSCFFSYFRAIKYSKPHLENRSTL